MASAVKWWGLSRPTFGRCPSRVRGMLPYDVFDRRENGTVSLAARRGQVHVFGQRFARKMRLPAEKWTSPQPTADGRLFLERLVS